MTGDPNSNSTDTTSSELARRLFADVVVPLAADHPELRLAFDAAGEAASHYAPAHRPVLTRADMQTHGVLADLASLWAGTGLEALLPELRTLAATIADERAGGTDDRDAPSTLIYQMY